jgi:hypothetical protein
MEIALSGYGNGLPTMAANAHRLRAGIAWGGAYRFRNITPTPHYTHRPPSQPRHRALLVVSHAVLVSSAWHAHQMVCSRYADVA